jgi:hypothetical protein
VALAPFSLSPQIFFRVMISIILLVVVGQYRLIVCSTAPAVIISRCHFLHISNIVL